MSTQDITIFDNGGKSIERYTVIIGNAVYGMSRNPKDPQGFNQYWGSVSDLVKNSYGFYDQSTLGKEKKLEALPQEVQEAIRERMKISHQSR